MHPVFHILVSLLIGLFMGFHHRNRLLIILVAAFTVNGILDLDFILYTRGIFSIRYFHTCIVMIYLPALAISIAYLYEKRKGWDSSLLTRISMMIFLMTSSHLLMDTYAPGDAIYLNYPFVMAEYEMPVEMVPYAIALFAVLIAVFNLVETELWKLEKYAGGKFRGVGEKRSFDDFRGGIHWKR